MLRGRALGEALSQHQQPDRVRASALFVSHSRAHGPAHTDDLPLGNVVTQAFPEQNSSHDVAPPRLRPASDTYSLGSGPERLGLAAQLRMGGPVAIAADAQILSHRYCGSASGLPRVAPHAARWIERIFR